MLDQHCGADDQQNNEHGFDGLAYSFLVAGLLLTGVGASPIYTLGITYLDENVAQSSSPLYMGVFLGCSVLGPALGYMLGGVFLRIDGDIISKNTTQSELEPEDSRWYGK